MLRIWTRSRLHPVEHVPVAVAGRREGLVRLVFEGESTVRVVDLTWVEYNLLTVDQRLQVKGSGALDGYIDTVGISNA